MLRVLIVGGGIGGLCLAQGLRQAGIEVSVFERDVEPDARLQGYRLNVEPVGSRALRHCLPAHLWDRLVATSGDPGPGMGVFTEDLRLLMLENSDPADTHAVSRANLRTLLLTGLGDVVRFGKEFDRYEQSDDGTVTAFFADGTSATGDVLVGADGARSRVRAQLLPHVRRIDTGGVGVGGKLPLTAETAAWLPAGITTRKNMVLPRRDFLFTSVFRRRGTGGEESDYVMWAFVAHRDTYPAADTGTALRDHVEHRMADWHPDLRRMVRESDPDTVQRFDFGAGERVKPWPTTTVTVLGDAIHAMPPVGGLGGNAALRDASALCQALTAVHRGESALLPALHGYEAEMIEQGFAASREAQLYTKLAILRSRTVRTTARTFFRVCGAIPPLRREIFEN